LKYTIQDYATLGLRQARDNLIARGAREGHPHSVSRSAINPGKVVLKVQLQRYDLTRIGDLDGPRIESQTDKPRWLSIGLRP